jgi:hypothetical protein
LISAQPRGRSSLARTRFATMTTIVGDCYAETGGKVVSCFVVDAAK